MPLARPTLCRLLLVLFALVSCAGKGLHLLPGAGHWHGHAAVHRSDCGDSHGHSHACGHHGAGVECTFPSPQPFFVGRGSQSLAAPALLDCVGDCTICAFFAQGQILVASHVPAMCGKVHFFSPVEQEPPCLAVVPRANAPRAPPLVS